MAEFKDKLKELRKSRGLTQAEFAEPIGVSRTDVIHYESGRRMPSAATLARIARSYQVSLDGLLLDQGDQMATIADLELLDYFTRVDRLSRQRRTLVKDLMDAVLAAEGLQRTAVAGVPARVPLAKTRDDRPARPGAGRAANSRKGASAQRTA